MTSAERDHLRHLVDQAVRAQLDRRECPGCGGPITKKTTGTRVYCTERCASRAWYRRKVEARQAALEPVA